MGVAGYSRNSRRMAWLACWSARPVTVQVFTRCRSATTPGGALSQPRPASSWLIPAVSHWFTLQPKVRMRKKRRAVGGGWFSAGMQPILTGLRGYFTLAKEMQEGAFSCRDFQTLSDPLWEKFPKLRFFEARSTHRGDLKTPRC